MLNSTCNADGSPPCDWEFTPVCPVEEWVGYSAQVRGAAMRFATYTLWAATGRRYGLCSMSVRPCRRDCESGEQGFFWSYGTWVPYILNGVWRNCWCGFGAGCGSCNASCQVWLPGPVDSVVEVVKNGEVVDPSTYRLDLSDGAYWLVRQHTGDEDNDCWPECQDFDRPLGEEDTWSVRYLKGIAVPAALLDAAAILAVEWARGCNGGTCRLPQRIQSLTRQGVTVSMVDIDSLLDRGLTGITEVDQVITANNPHAIKGRPRLASVETTRRVRYV